MTTPPVEARSGRPVLIIFIIVAALVLSALYLSMDAIEASRSPTQAAQQP